MTPKPTAIGIDLSTSATGVIVLEAHDDAPPVVLHEAEVKPPKGVVGMAAKRAVVTEVMLTIHAWKPKVIVVEGYSLNLKNASSIIPLVEIGGILRFLMHLDGLAWLAPTAGQVKQFATGKGNSPKDVVMMHVYKRFGYEARTNNLADAFACAAIGLATIAASPSFNQAMVKVAELVEAFTN